MEQIDLLVDLFDEIQNEWRKQMNQENLATDRCRELKQQLFKVENEFNEYKELIQKNEDKSDKQME